MKNIQHPIRNTILYGLACGLSFIPLVLILNALNPWTRAVGLTLWVFIAGYAILLNIWGKKNQLSTILPLLLLLPVLFLNKSLVLFFILALIVTSWIRSGICYPKSGVMVVGVELLLCLTGAVLVQIFTPGSVFGWALGVWMYFLVQALYFVFFDPNAKRDAHNGRVDAFEKASKQAEIILTDSNFV